MKYNNTLLLTLSLLTSANTMAAAYLFPELGMMSVSTAGAGAQAIAEGAETAFANPAGMTRLKQTTLAFNVEGSIANINYTDEGSTGVFSTGEAYTEAGTAMPAGSFYWVNPINDKVSVGVALASAGGSVIDYGDNFSGSLLLKDASLITVQVNPSVAYRVNDNLSLGLGVVAEFGKLEQNLGTTNVTLTGTGDSLEFGYTLSALYEFNHANRIGFIYRSETNHDMDGALEGEQISSPASFNIVMPSIASLSGYHEITPKIATLWSLGWSDLSKVQQTTITFPESTTTIDRQWQDTYSISVGAHYKLAKDWRLESGITYETSPQDDPTLQFPDVPTGDTWKLGVGASYDVTKNFRMQFYYEYFYGGNADIEYELDGLLSGKLQGEYDAEIHYFGVLMNYQF